MPADYRKNNFDLLRAIAALQVAFIHAVTHFGVQENLAIQIIKAVPGVPIFFVISGYLVSASFERRTLREYFTFRFLRIYPGLWACLLVSIASAMALGVTFDGPEVSTWLAAQLSIAQFYNPDFLRGYGTGVLNGALWTIPVELQFYLALPLLYSALRKRYVMITAIVLLIGVNQLFIHGADASLAWKLLAVTVLPYLYLFLFGVLLQREQELTRRLLFGKAPFWIGVYAVTAIAFSWAGIGVGGNDINPVSALLLGCAAISFAHTGTALKMHDLSYGIYIYHMVVINALLQLGFTGASTVAPAIGIAIGLAFISWVIIERPALEMKRLSWRTLQPISRCIE